MGALREAGLSNINIDLIAGLPGQTIASWRESLAWIERLEPPHVSVYMLEVDDDSRLGKELLLGGVRYGAADTPSDDATAAFYELAVERLAAMGLARYEISNFARPDPPRFHRWRKARRLSHSRVGSGQILSGRRDPGKRTERSGATYFGIRSGRLGNGGERGGGRAS